MASLSINGAVERMKVCGIKKKKKCGIKFLFPTFVQHCQGCRPLCFSHLCTLIAVSKLQVKDWMGVPIDNVWPKQIESHEPLFGKSNQIKIIPKILALFKTIQAKTIMQVKVKQEKVMNELDE